MIRSLLSSALLAMTTACVVAADPWTQAPLSPVPAVGVHPRVVFSPGDLPAWKRQLTTSDFAKALLPFARNQI